MRLAAPSTFKTKADADAFLSAVETDLNRGAWLDPKPGRATVADLARDWLASNPDKRASSKARDESILRLHVLPGIGSTRVSDVMRRDVQAMVDSWSSRQQPSTAIRRFTCLRALFTYAEDTERIVRSPCQRIRLPKHYAVARAIPTAKELERLADVLGPDQAAFMWVGAVLGLRWAEVARLSVDRIDFLGGKVTVDRQLARSGFLEPPKSKAGMRTIACPTWLLDDLAALLRSRGLTATDRDSLVFASGSGAQLDYTNWRRREWVPACEDADLAGLHFHDLRALAATALIASGTDVKTAQTRLGHASSRTTIDLYAKATELADRNAAVSVGDFFRPYRTQSARKTPIKKGGRTK